MRDTRGAVGRLPVAIRASITLLGLLCISATAAAAQRSGDACPRPTALEPGAFERPMTFAAATNKGNMNTSAWISATGTIDPGTPDRFRAFVESEEFPPGQIVLHSPGGNLAAGLELGRMIREAGLTVHIGRTERSFEGYDAPCDTWYDRVEAGICASSCAYAFLGGRERFVDSPYYPTAPNRLGFHQFYGSPDQGSDMLTPAQAAEIQASTMSVAQALTGKIVLYAIEMGVDPRIVAFASATRSDDLYHPTAAEIDELAIASGTGLEPWFMEPYGDGLVTATKPYRSDSMLRQVTAFCRGAGTAQFLITMDLATPSFSNPDDLPLNAVEMTIDNDRYAITRPDLLVRYGDRSIFITVPVRSLEPMITRASRIDFRLDAARVMGGFSEGNDLDETARRSIALAWRNCI